VLLSICKKLALSSPTNGVRSVGLVRSRTQATEFFQLWKLWNVKWRYWRAQDIPLLFLSSTSSIVLTRLSTKEHQCNPPRISFNILKTLSSIHRKHTVCPYKTLMLLIGIADTYTRILRVIPGKYMYSAEKKLRFYMYVAVTLSSTVRQK
jgi:hypothetical protein